MAYGSIYKGGDSIIILETKEEWDNYQASEETRMLNEREYAKQHKSEKVHYLFHAGCSNCVTPLHYGIGNCLGCQYFDCDWSKPELRIKDYIKQNNVNN
jgi:hypothetical protein